MARPHINATPLLSAVAAAETVARNLTAAYHLNQVKGEAHADYLVTRRLEDAQTAYVRLIELFAQIGKEPAAVVDHPRRKEGQVRALVKDTADAMKSFSRIENLRRGPVSDGLPSDSQPSHEKA